MIRLGIYRQALLRYQKHTKAWCLNAYDDSLPSDMISYLQLPSQSSERTANLSQAAYDSRNPNCIKRHTIRLRWHIVPSSFPRPFPLPVLFIVLSFFLLGAAHQVASYYGKQLFQGVILNQQFYHHLQSVLLKELKMESMWQNNLHIWFDVKERMSS